MCVSDDFLHTTVDSAILTSPTFQLNKEKCIQLLVGLCAECDAEVVLRDSVSYEVLERITTKGSPAIHGLPQWQFVTINKTSSESGYTNVKIELIPKLNSASANPLWAIANIRQCPPHGIYFLNYFYLSAVPETTVDLNLANLPSNSFFQIIRC